MLNFTLSNVPANSLRAVTIAAAKSDTRYYLNGICIQRAGGIWRAIATDGHRLHLVEISLDCVTSATPEDGAVIIPRDLMLQALKVAGKGRNASDIQIVSIDGIITLTVQGAAFTAPAIDGQFPDWRRVIPKELNGEPAQFTIDYLADAQSACELIGNKSPVIAYNGTSPAVITAPGYPEFCAVIMPCRDNGKGEVTDSAYSRAVQ